MDEEKKTSSEERTEPETPAESTAETPEIPRLFDETEKAQPAADAPKVVKNQPDPKEEKKRQKKQQKKKAKAEKNKKYPHKLSFLLGLIILIFAVVGVVLTGWNAVRYIRSTTDSVSEYAQYNAYLEPIAAVDPDPFDDITAADQEQLLNAAIWSILSNDTTPDVYTYSGGYLLIPSSDVGKAYVALFGQETERTLTHRTVQGYNCTFEYDATAQMYKIPVTTILPVYTPQVTDAKQSGSTLVLTVNFLASESWNKDGEGNFIAPEPDKTMKITLREQQGSYYISALQTVSATVPETVSFEMTTAAPVTEPASETTAVTETTSAVPADPEKTTLGGRVF